MGFAFWFYHGFYLEMDMEILESGEKIMLGRWAHITWFIFGTQTLPILDTLQKMTNSLLVNVDIPIDTKRLKD